MRCKILIIKSPLRPLVSIGHKNKKTQQNKQKIPAFSPAPLMNVFGTILQARINTYFLRHLFRDLRLPIEPCLGSCSPLTIFFYLKKKEKNKPTALF